MKSILLKNTILGILFFAACKKSDFLNSKPDQSLVVPTTLKDFQGILDNDRYMNGAGNNGIIPSLGEIGADNYYLADADYVSNLMQNEQNEYIWAKQVYPGIDVVDWNQAYRSVFYSNIVLEGLSKINITTDQQTIWNNLEGSALFYRAHMFYQLAQVFAPPYNENSASTDLGIPLRLGTQVNDEIQRASIQQTYDKIIADLKSALALLPRDPLYKTRPSSIAVFGLLARVYQTMQNYDSAFAYANNYLQLKNTLLDYNNYISNPIPRFNDEVIFNCLLSVPAPIRYNYVDTVLYSSYDLNDLRKTLFFGSRGGKPNFGMSYDGFQPFGGIATDEVYLIRAECYARKGNTNAALTDLNALLNKRWKSGTFTPYTATDANDALRQILSERRKELVWRALRWTDLRRLNKDPQFAITLKRIIQGQAYTLPPNDLRYVYPIPDNVISFNPGMPQNPR